MVGSDFFSKLREIREEYDWSIKEGHIRGRRRGTTCDCCNMGYCPITAVARSMVGISYFPIQYLNAAEAIHLRFDIAKDIVVSADIAGYYRKQLLEAVGLENEECHAN